VECGKTTNDPAKLTGVVLIGLNAQKKEAIKAKEKKQKR